VRKERESSYQVIWPRSETATFWLQRSDNCHYRKLQGVSGNCIHWYRTYII